MKPTLLHTLLTLAALTAASTLTATQPKTSTNTIKPALTTNKTPTTTQTAGVRNKNKTQLQGNSGTPIKNRQIAGTWDDTGTAPTQLYSITVGDYKNWKKPLDIAIGAINKQQGQTWQEAAAGQMNEQWTQTLTLLAKTRQHQPTYIRLAHEFNGAWTPWAVTKNDIRAFKQAWRNFRKLQKQIMPQAKLVYCPNHMTSPELKYDWRKTYPGKKYVDYHCTDTYNQQPNNYNKPSWRGYINYRDTYRAPAGIQTHLTWAKKQHLPMVIGEWGTNTKLKNSSTYLKKMGAWLHKNAGNQPGKIWYHIYFNITKPNSPYQICPNHKKLCSIYKQHIL